MAGNEFNVYSINNVIPIRPGMHDMSRERKMECFLQETLECQRYEDKICRTCDQPRGELSPWCATHFPWRLMGQEILPSAPESDDTKEPIRLY